MNYEERDILKYLTGIERRTAEIRRIKMDKLRHGGGEPLEETPNRDGNPKVCQVVTRFREILDLNSECSWSNAIRLMEEWQVYEDNILEDSE